MNIFFKNLYYKYIKNPTMYVFEKIFSKSCVFYSIILLIPFLLPPLVKQLIPFPDTFLINMEVFLSKVSNNFFELFATQISITFLVTSFLSILGDKDDLVYHTNVMQFKLISPKARSFSDITTYCILTLVVSVVTIFLKYPSAFVVSFVFNIIGLIIVTKRILKVYYKKDKLKAEIRKDFTESKLDEKDKKVENIVDNAKINIEKCEREKVLESIELLFAENYIKAAKTIIDKVPTTHPDWLPDIYYIIKNNELILSKKIFWDIINNCEYTNIQILKELLISYYEDYFASTKKLFIDNYEAIVYQLKYMVPFYIDEQGAYLTDELSDGVDFHFEELFDNTNRTIHWKVLLALCEIFEEFYFKIYPLNFDIRKLWCSVVKINDESAELIKEILQTASFEEKTKDKIQKFFGSFNYEEKVAKNNKRDDGYTEINYIVDIDDESSIEYTLSSKYVINHLTSKGPFEKGRNLKEINVEKGNNYHESIDGVLYDKKYIDGVFYDKCFLIKYPPKKEGTSYTLPENTIPFYGAFKYCKNIETVTLSPVRTIYFQAFCNCPKLKKIEYLNSLESSVIKIEEWAFAGCTSLKELPIQEKTETIKEYAFSRCENLSEVILPDSIKQIATGAFNKCINLKKVIFSQNINLFIIEPYTFYGCKSLKEVTIPSNITKIDNSAFLNCPKDMTIYGTKGSAAQNFAKRNGYKFVEIK